MNTYKGISKTKHPDWRGWDYMSLYGALPIKWDEDEPLQGLVKRHYLKIRLYKTAFNLGVYAVFYGIIKLTIG